MKNKITLHTEQTALTEVVQLEMTVRINNSPSYAKEKNN